MNKIALLSTLSLSLLFGCEEETEKVQIEVKSVECTKNNRYKDAGCFLTTTDDRTYEYGKDLYYVKEGVNLELEVKGFNNVRSIRYLENDGDKNE